MIPGTLSIRLSEDFQPNGIASGPGDNQLTLTSWSGIRTLDLRDRKPHTGPSTNVSRSVYAHSRWTRRLCQASRGEIALRSSRSRKRCANEEPAEPVVFGGSIGIAQFSSDGKRLLILSGGMLNVFDRMRLIDVTPVYRTQEAAPENFEEKPAPPWLADIASAVSALDTARWCVAYTGGCAEEVSAKAKLVIPTKPSGSVFSQMNRATHGRRCVAFNGQRRHIELKIIAGGGARTHTTLRPLDFESSASANSATPALGGKTIRDSSA